MLFGQRKEELAPRVLGRVHWMQSGFVLCTPGTPLKKLLAQLRG